MRAAQQSPQARPFRRGGVAALSRGWPSVCTRFVPAVTPLRSAWPRGRARRPPIGRGRPLAATSKPPPGGGARVGKVGAIRAGADSPVEMLAELGMVLTDPGRSPGGPRGSHRLEHARTRMRLVDRGHPGQPRATALERGSRVRRPPARPARRPRGRAPARCRLRSRRGVDGTRLLARASRISPASPRPCATGRPPGGSRRCATLPALGGDEVEHVELPARVGEEPREVPHALEVSHSHRAPLEHHRPVVALATKDVEVCGAAPRPVRRRPRWALPGPPSARLRSGRGSCGPLGAPRRPGPRCRRRGGLRRGPSVRAPPHRARRPRSRVAPPRSRTAPRPRHRPRRAAPFPAARVALATSALLLESSGHELQFVGG